MFSVLFRLFCLFGFYLISFFFLTAIIRTFVCSLHFSHSKSECFRTLRGFKSICFNLLPLHCAEQRAGASMSQSWVYTYCITTISHFFFLIRNLVSSFEKGVFFVANMMASLVSVQVDVVWGLLVVFLSCEILWYSFMFTSFSFSMLYNVFRNDVVESWMIYNFLTSCVISFPDWRYLSVLLITYLVPNQGMYILRGGSLQWIRIRHLEQ